MPFGKPPRFDGRVLVAEDNPVNREVVLAMLEPLGCQVTVADDGQEALVALAREPFDLVLMDCQMPVLDGFAATKAWRQQEVATGKRRVPIIALTADVIKGVRERCLEAGMDGYLSKPLEQVQLVTALDRWLPAIGEVAAAPAVAPSAAATPPATPSTALPASPLDQRALDQIRAMQRPGSPDLLGKIIGLYLENSPGLLRQIRDAVAGQDGDALRQAAHSLKSSSASLGATELAALCKALEQRGRDRQLEDAAELLREMEIHYARAREALLGEMR